MMIVVWGARWVGACGDPRPLTWLPTLVMRPAVVGSVRPLHPWGAPTLPQPEREQCDLALAGRKLVKSTGGVILVSRPTVCSRSAGTLGTAHRGRAGDPTSD